MTQVRVVAALHLSEPSGPSRSLGPALARLANTAEVVVAVPREGRVAAELAGVGRIVALGHRPVVIPRSVPDAVNLLLRHRAETRRFRELLRRERADVAVIATTTLPALMLAARLERVPAVLYAAELYSQGRRGDVVRERAGRALLRWNARHAAVTVACSYAVRDLLPPSSPQVVMYPSIDPAVAGGDADAFRRRHGIPATGPCFAVIGNLTRGRGQDVMIRALAQLRRSHPGARVVLVGAPHPWPVDQIYADELPRLAEALGVADAVHLCGFDDVADVLAAADVVVNPARISESFGRVAMEALLAGRPVVSSAVGAVPEVLTDEEHALLVPPDRPDALAAALERLLVDPQLAAELVRRGAQHVRMSFTEDRQLPQFARAIERALGGTPPP